jgi:hypothetical protein
MPSDLAECSVEVSRDSGQTYELQPGQEEISKGTFRGAAAMSAASYFHWLLTKVAYRPHIKRGGRTARFSDVARYPTMAPVADHQLNHHAMLRHRIDYARTESS